MAIIASKGLSLTYKYLMNREIAHIDEAIEMTDEDFRKIKNDCSQYEITRDKHRTYHNVSSILSMASSVDEILKCKRAFENYSDIMIQIAKSILQYNSQSFIKQLARNNISYVEIQAFLSMINIAKEDVKENLRLLYENSELIDLFYNFSIESKMYFGYGNFKCVINKLEQLYIFENDSLKDGLNKQHKYTKK